LVGDSAARLNCAASRAAAVSVERVADIGVDGSYRWGLCG
jgi:hypothetical protein